MKNCFDRKLAPWVVIIFSTLWGVPCVNADEFSGFVNLEGRYYFSDPVFIDQKDGGASLVSELEYRHKWDNDLNVLTFVPFYRLDQRDKERTHADIRQLDIIMARGDWEFQGGISKIFWGVTESAHLVDIINQTDGVESLVGEEKLGQPLFSVSYLLDNGSVSFFVLPYFRERTFSGKKGRLRFQFPVDTDDISYESPDREKNIDYAFRLQHTFDEIDLGISYFDGTSRIPIFIPDFSSGVLKQYYPLINQTGLDLQYTGEEWLLKLEAIYVDAMVEDYAALVGGFEYTTPRVAGTSVDLGLLLEYLYDSRGEVIYAPFQNDLFVGARVVMNNINDTEFLLGAFIDLDNQTKSFNLEASTRLTEDLKLNLEIQAFVDVDNNDPLNDLKKDGYVQLELQMYL